MKKLSFLGMALIAGLSVSAQSNFTIIDAPAKINTNFRDTPVNTPVLEARAKGSQVDIWTNGFDDPSDWTISSVATSASPRGWSIDDTVIDNWFGYETVDFPIRNGNFVFLSNGDPNESNPSSPSFATPGVPHILISKPIDVSGYESSGFAVSFAIDGRKFVDDLETYISGDNGDSWTLLGDLTDVGTNSSSGMNGVRRKYIAVPADYNSSSTVLIRFIWNGETNGGEPNGITYGMFLDDVALSVIEDNDLEMTLFSNTTGNLTGGFSEGVCLGQTPVSDMVDNRWFMCIVKNNGVNTETAYVNLTVENASGDSIVIDNASDSLAIPGFGGIDTMYFAYIPSQWEADRYLVTGTLRASGVELNEDNTPVNNVATTSFDVSNNILATNLKNYQVGGDINNMVQLTGSSVETPQIVSIYNRWIQFEEITFRGLSTKFLPETQAAANIEYGIWGTSNGGALDDNLDLFTSKVLDDNGTATGIVLGDTLESGKTFYKFRYAKLVGLEINMIDTSVTLPGSPDGIIYAVGLKTPDDAQVNIRGAAKFPNLSNSLASLMYGPYGANQAPGNLRAPASPIFELSKIYDLTSVKENANRPTFYLAQNRPNPFNRGSIVTYQLNKKANNVSFEVFDVTGKQVMAVNEGTKGAGQYNIQLNGSDFTTGLYYYSLTVNGQKLTRKMVITE